MNPLGAYFPQSGQINFRKRVVLRKKGSCTQATSSFQISTCKQIHRARPREVLRVSSLILRAKLSLAKKVLRHGNRFAARVHRRYFSEGEKRRPEIRLRFAG